MTNIKLEECVKVEYIIMFTTPTTAYAYTNYNQIVYTR